MISLIADDNNIMVAIMQAKNLQLTQKLLTAIISAEERGCGMKKKSKTYIGRALSYEMHRAEITQSALAQRAGLPQPTISQLISSAVRIAPASLIALSNCWGAETNIRVLIAHLRDEIARAGHDPENTVDILPKKGNAAPTRAEKITIGRD